MKLHLLNRTSPGNSSFMVSHNLYPHFLKIWHYHPELELIAIEKSSGTQFIGDSIEKFDVGEVILIGKNLPHMLLNDDVYFDESSKKVAESFVVHFKKEFLGNGFLTISETKPITDLLDRAGRGIKFLQVDNQLIQDIKGLLNLEPFERLIKFVEILNALAKHKPYRLLSSMGYVNSFLKTENKRLHKIYEYVFKNFKNSIGASDVASVIGMNPSAFSRFFKQVHRKTFTRYLNEIRIGYACKLLLEDKMNITAIAYESGFNNISNFNRQFKMIIGKPPSSYIQYHTDKMEYA
ncbi:AraC family transcriptional regulator [Flagellimonas onchidii]|uniref:AraC family transcriptional regulator n=1 Tax=Flagellimonas onchidii TaxID=2562684 RepID=UPI0010A67E72|nr:AraC family transcriptional regulator [Allomuricauda onchidii]